MILKRGSREQVYSGNRVICEIIKAAVVLVGDDVASLQNARNILKDHWFFKQRDGYVRSILCMEVGGVKDNPELYVEIRDDNREQITLDSDVQPLIIEPRDV